MNNFFPKVFFARHLHNKFLCQKGYSSALSSDYVDVPQYPPIEDPSFIAKIERRKAEWHTKIQKLPTVEQKLMELNMPKYYGFSCVQLCDRFPKVNGLDFLKYITRTHVVKEFPDRYYKNLEGEAEDAAKKVKSKIEDLVLLHFNGHLFRNRQRLKIFTYEKNVTQNFIVDLNNLMMTSLVDVTSHLSPTAIDLEPRIEGFWFVGGFEPMNSLKKRRESSYTFKKHVDYPVDRPMRSSVHPALALRIKDGLPEVVPINDDLATNGQIPLANYQNNTVGLGSKFRNAVIIPGFWPGESHENGHLFFHSREPLQHIIFRNGRDCLDVVMEQQAILTSFTQAHSYAFYQGFTPVNEMTYSITQQNMSTDGRNIQFGVYQMNTCALHSDRAINNPHNNILWLSNDMPLYETIEGDSVKGLNEEVIKKICLMYLKKGEPRTCVNPNIGDYKYLMDHDAPEEYKDEFVKSLHYRTSERPRFLMKPEILPWEKIYKVLFKTRHMDAKRKFFEFRWAKNPYKRRLDDYQLKQIPRVRRINHKINYLPRINTEHLYKHDWSTIKQWNLYPDDEVAFKSMNIKKDSAPYYTGLKWSRSMINPNPKI